MWEAITASSDARDGKAAIRLDYLRREGALCDDFARRMRALETQIAQAQAEIHRLRAENRALLNSVLGIAGIPPVIVDEPPAEAVNPASIGVPDLPFAGAQHGSAALTTSATPGADACDDAAHSATMPIPHGRHPEERSDEVAPSSRLPLRDEPLFVSRDCLEEQSKRDPSLPSGTRDDSPVGGNVAPIGAASPSTIVAPSGSDSPSLFAGRSSAPPLQNQTPRSDAHVIAPVRRRSWHQIYRMLEFESSRRKEQDS